MRGDVTFLEGQLRASLMQREALQRRKCDWHLFFVLILRGRYLSARNPGPASPVEACHPLCIFIILDWIADSPENLDNLPIG